MPASIACRCCPIDLHSLNTRINGADAAFQRSARLYAPDIVSSGKDVTLPLTVQILLGNGKRPVATDDGTMKPQEFAGYVSLLVRTGAVRAIPFRIQKKGERLSFQYLSRSYVVTAAELIPCSGCAGRVVLKVQPELRR